MVSFRSLHDTSEPVRAIVTADALNCQRATAD